MPFISVRSQPGFYLPGCVHRTKEKTNDLTSYLNSNALKDLREEYLNPSAQFNEGCKRCQIAEAAKQPSYRTMLNERFKNYGLEKIIYYDAFPGNVCNLKCLMCDHHTSSSIAAEYKQIGWITDYQFTDYSERIIEDLKNLPDLIEVSLIGGEFFLTKKNKEILQYCIDRKLSVTVTTNGTIIDEELLDLLLKINNLTLRMSVDGFKETYELIRYPATWENWNSNVSIIIKKLLNKAKLNFACVLQPLNLQSFVPLLDHNNKLKLKTDVTWIAEPSWLGWTILTLDEKILLAKYVNSQIYLYKLTNQQKTHLNSVLKELLEVEFNETNREMFIMKMKILLKHRRIPINIIRTQFGLLEDLSNKVIDEKI
jgi:sulfatase maturation enzyme AslB (radical SAM superfamily)